jgi:ABC-type phosphate transport system substrate-binding protein
MAFACVSPAAAIVLSQEADSDITLRLSEPQELAFPAYQVGSDELLVITHPLVGVGGLTPVQVEGLFAGQFTSWSSVGGSDQPVHVWAYAAAVDIQSYFERVILHDRPVSSLARLAVSAQHMSDSVGSVPGSIGLLPRRWATGNLHEALLVANIPVLALTQSAPSGEVAHLLECMQAKRK